MTNETNETQPTAGKPRPRLGRIALAALVTVGVAGAFAGSAIGGDWSSRAQGPGHHRMMFAASFDPAQMDERIGKMVDHLAIEIDATDEQKTQLKTIFVDAANDLMPLREKAGDRGEAAAELIGLLTQPTVDRAAVETFRADKIALADEASRRVADALVDAAEVLTPEQREKVGDRLSFFTKLGSFHRG